MSIFWLVYANLAGLAAYVAGLTADAAMQALQRSRRVVWIVMLGFAALAPALGTLLPTDVAMPHLRGMPDVVPIVTEAAHTTIFRAAARLDDGYSLLSIRLFLLAWLTCSIVLAIRLWSGHRALAQRKAAWRSAELDGISILISPDFGPAVAGVFNMVMVIPKWMLALTPGLRRMIIQHESEHIRNRDPMWRFIASLLLVLFPWNLAIWLIERRLALAMELDCDRQVISKSRRRDVYGRLLVAIAQRGSQSSLAVAIAGNFSNLDRRIRAMTRRPERYPRLFAICMVALCAVFIAASLPLLSSSALASPHSMVQQQTKGAMLLPSSPKPSYPETLRARGVSGAVVAEFVVDTAGRADRSTYRAVNDPNPLFSASVRAMLPRMRFSPAEVNGRKVRQLIRQKFEFTPTS